MFEYGPDFCFELWGYVIAHSCLLIRCPKLVRTTRDYNVDIVFEEVRYVSIPKYMKGLTVRRVDSYEGLTCPYVRKGSAVENIFLLTSEGIDHVIVAFKSILDINKMDIYADPFDWHPPTPSAP